MGPTFVGFGYRKQVGKDTLAKMVAQYLNSRYGDTVVRFESFASPLKRLAMDCFGLTWEQCYGTDEDKNSLTQVYPEHIGIRDLGGKHPAHGRYLTAREVLQLLGTDVMRRHIPGIWVNAPFRRAYDPHVKFVLITDVRFPDEGDVIKEHGGLLVRVERPGLEAGDQHASEIAMAEYPAWDMVVNNRGTLGQLMTEASRVAYRINDGDLYP